MNAVLDVPDLFQVLQVDACVHAARALFIRYWMDTTQNCFRFTTEWRVVFNFVDTDSFKGKLGLPWCVVERRNAFGSPVPRPVRDKWLDVVRNLAYVHTI